LNERLEENMAKCEICDKSTMYGRRISITRSQVSRRAKTERKPNIRRVRVMENGTPRRRNVCARCLRSGAVTRA